MSGAEGVETAGADGDPAEDATLGSGHLQADFLELREVRTHAVAQHQALVPAVVRLPHVVWTQTSVVTPVRIRWVMPRWASIAPRSVA